MAGFFRLIQTLTGDQVWRDRSDHAWAFVESVWNDADGFFWTGTEEDGATINKLGTQLPLDAADLVLAGPPAAAHTGRRWTGPRPTSPPPTPLSA